MRLLTIFLAFVVAFASCEPAFAWGCRHKREVVTHHHVTKVKPKPVVKSSVPTPVIVPTPPEVYHPAFKKCPTVNGVCVPGHWIKSKKLGLLYVPNDVLIAGAITGVVAGAANALGSRFTNWVWPEKQPDAAVKETKRGLVVTPIKKRGFILLPALVTGIVSGVGVGIGGWLWNKTLPPKAWTAKWYEYCAHKFPSFDIRTGFYTDTAGQLHFCE